MPTVRVHKTKDYTTMSNYHLKDKRLSLKGKGLLSVMLSLSDEWKYSIEGLVAILKENETSVNSTLKELKELGYLEVIKLMPNETKTGRIEYIYNVYENPKQEDKKQDLESLGVESLGVESMGVANNIYIDNNINNNKILNNKDTNNKTLNHNNKQQRHKYGEYGRILLTDEQYQKLCEEYNKDFIDDAINKVDAYVESNNNKNNYKNFYAVLKNAINGKWCNIDYEAFKKKKNPSNIDRWLNEGIIFGDDD